MQAVKDLRTIRRIMSLGCAAGVLSFAGLAGATVIHTEIIGLSPGLVNLSSGQTMPPPPTEFTGPEGTATGSFTVPSGVLANPLLKAVKVELLVSYLFEGEFMFFESGALLLEVFGSAKARCVNENGLEFVFAGRNSGPPYDDTQTVVGTHVAGGSIFTLVPISTMSSSFGSVSEPFELGCPEFEYLTKESDISWRVDFYFNVFATEQTTFQEGASPYFLGGTANYNYDPNGFVSQLIVTYYIPEPSALALMGLGALALSRRRRR